MGGAYGAGAKIGRFEIINRIAVGGMAEIYVARTRAAHGFEKIVALKRIFPNFVEDADFVEMFLHEARLAARLSHPNIAQVYEIGDDDGIFFFTMEYVLGQDIRRIVRAIRARGGWFTLDQIISIVAHTAAGLHYAHEREDSDGKPLGIVHRDVSPSNILVSYDGGVKLVDFGIARASSRQAVTQAGVLKGKIPYMSPEQCRGEPIDRRTDIYALGVILWELAVGRRLWSGNNDIELARRIASEAAAPPTASLPNFPSDLEAIIMRAVAHDRDQRYATAQELQVDLEEFARERKLVLSSVSLERFMRELFATTILEQKAALVEAEAGRSTSFPVLESSGAIPPHAVAAGIARAAALRAVAAREPEGEARSPSLGGSRSERLWIVGAIVLGLGVALGGYYGWRSGRGQAVAASAAAGPAGAPPATPAVAITPPAAGDAGAGALGSAEAAAEAEEAEESEESEEAEGGAGSAAASPAARQGKASTRPKPRAPRQGSAPTRSAAPPAAAPSKSGDLKDPFGR